LRLGSDIWFDLVFQDFSFWYLFFGVLCVERSLLFFGEVQTANTVMIVMEHGF
jgi:hypothetical protein